MVFRCLPYILEHRPYIKYKINVISGVVHFTELVTNAIIIVATEELIQVCDTRGRSKGISGNIFTLSSQIWINSGGIFEIILLHFNLLIASNLCIGVTSNMILGDINRHTFCVLLHWKYYFLSLSLFNVKLSTETCISTEVRQFFIALLYHCCILYVC